MNAWLLVAAAVVVSAGVTAGVMSLYAGQQSVSDLNPSADNPDDNDAVSQTPLHMQGDRVEGPDADMMPSGNGMGAEAGAPVPIVSDAHLSDLLASAYTMDSFGSMPQFRSAMQADMMMVSEDAAWAGAEPVAQSARMMDESAGSMPESGAALAPHDGADHSTTNVQVQGVDEPDYIKNDGQYAYIATRNVLHIIDVWPASEMHVVAKVALDINFQYIHDMFLNGDDLVVLFDARGHNLIIREYGFEPTPSYAPVTGVMIIDVADRESPAVRAAYSIDGRLADARMIGSHVYVISTTPLDHAYPRLPVAAMIPAEHSWSSQIPDSESTELPALHSAPLNSSNGNGSSSSSSSDQATSRAYYFEDDAGFSSFTTISAIDLADSSGSQITSETFLMGHTSTYYVTHSNLYLTYVQYLPHGYDHDLAARERFFKVIVPLLPDAIQSEILDAWERAVLPGSTRAENAWGAISAILQNYYNTLGPDMRDSLFEDIRAALASYDSELVRDHTKTIIHKVSIDGSDMKYEARGSVPGRLLNQFSLGESGGGERLRVATTVEYYTEYGGFERSNSVYALDVDLNSVGALEGVAPDESIYSVRFMGDRMYMVTFEQIDPFFVIDISGDTPIVLGELKIPGFSTYLHPYDDDHIIGLGRDTKLEDGGSWVRHLGLKVALFGVKDVSNPVVVDDLIIGGDSAHSDALYDHRAFFFDGARSMMSMPIEGPVGTVGDPKAQHASRPPPGHAGDPGRWSGFYIIDVDAKDGLDIRGMVSHKSDTEQYRHLVPARTFYIGDVLYTVSNGVLIASDINSLEKLGHVKLAGTGGLIDFVD